MVRSSPRRPGSRTMNWLRWLLAYLFDCVHPHTTWPHRDRVGFAYVCCLDCGRELPYSLQRMRIVTTEERLADRNPGAWHGTYHACQGRLIKVAYQERFCSSWF